MVGTHWLAVKNTSLLLAATLVAACGSVGSQPAAPICDGSNRLNLVAARVSGAGRVPPGEQGLFENGTPQEYKVRTTEEHAFLKFFSPLPLWAERRFMLLGRHADATGCLLSYRLPLNELPAEEQFIQKRLWLVRSSAAEPGVR